MRVCKILLILYLSMFSLNTLVHAQWYVDCSNYCSFNEFTHNCQGAYWLYPDGSKGYSAWSTNYNGCLEVSDSQLNTHLLMPNQITCSCSAPTTTPPLNTSSAMTATTRQDLELLRAQIKAWTYCGPDPRRNFSDLFHPVNSTNIQGCQSMRKNNVKNSYLSVDGCLTGLRPTDDWVGCNYSGDQTGNATLICMYGDYERCNDIKEAQDPITGAWYRNPFQRYHPETAYGQPLFSRDMMKGMLSYVAVKRDKPALTKWLNFIKNQPLAPPGNLINICPSRPNITKPSQVTQAQWDAMLPDDRCMLMPAEAGLLYFVSLYVGFTNTELNSISASLYSAMATGSLVLASDLTTEASTTPVAGGSSYRAALIMDALNILSISGGISSSTILGAAQTINDRSNKLNPGYHYLASNKVPTEYGAYLVKKYCKGIRPNYGVWYPSGSWTGWPSNSNGYWNSGQPIIAGNYQYYGGFGPYGVKILPNGHDCLTWLNMYLENANYTEQQCDAGDTLINGACLKSAFAVPTLAWIYGINYQLRISDAKITYAPLDKSSCPYGGTLEPNTGYQYTPQCVFNSGLSTGQLNGSANYWVDPTPNWPGIYYSKVNGNCIYGGTSSTSSNCLIKAYSVPEIFPSVAYTVDTNPSYSGVYYNQVSGACPYGGTISGSRCQIRSFAAGFLNTSKTYFVRANPAHPGVYYYPNVVTEQRRKGWPSVPVQYDKGVQ